MDISRLIRNLNIVVRTLKRQINGPMNKLGLNDSNYYMVLRVYDQPGITQEELSMDMKRERSLVTKSVNKLIKSNWIKVKNDDTDKRVLHLYPTELAREHHTELMGILRDNNETGLEMLTSTEKTMFLQLLQKITDAMDDRP
ncbi:MarR family winged helix-turn-helix transcriptional regulator [Secundilactobacillus collinoides]|uniref:HTH marR-type domain-containing protein n=2 Tax=Secundilactobacillus collinoides TaxID=33960 RepID=A0A0R2BIN1_SECCO|nr:MarR family transcriptional regulator [Secundilactobacillus collinoides]KRM76089.1 hypothetical protein FC82_GL001917 [Secundilactobacillus collinoides DSM 20515 = JCM 1123]KZL35838.1 hypothetical protein TY91_15245 [Secundilactobacillus collinoides]